MATFDEYLKLGNIGERIVEKYLQNNLGWWTIPSYLYQSDGMAPHIRRAGKVYIVPDLDCCSEGTRRWVEVKTKHHSPFNRCLGAHVHGIARPHYWDYVRVEKETGSHVLLCILEVATGALLLQGLAFMEAFPCMCSACKSGSRDRCCASIRDHVYFKRDDFKLLHTFSELEMLRVRKLFEELKNEDDRMAHDTSLGN